MFYHQAAMALKTASAVAGERFEKSMDKPVEGCETAMGVLLMLWVHTNILPHLAGWSTPFFAL